MDAKKTWLTLGLALALAAPAATSPLPPLASPPPSGSLLGATTTIDDGDEAYRFLVGLVEREMWEMAVDAAGSFLDEHPRHAKVHLARYRLATSLFELDRRADALPHYRTLSQRDGFEYRLEALFRLGECALELDRYPLAEEALAAVLAEPEGYLTTTASFLFAETAFRAGRHEAAEERYLAWLERWPEAERGADARRALAWCAWARHDEERTAQRCRGFLQRHGGDATRLDAIAELRVLLGEALLALEEPQDALATFLEVTEGRFHDAALRGAGFARAATGDHAGAAREFAALQERYPESRYAGEAALQRGVELVRAGRAAAAVEVLRTVARGGDAESCLWLARAEDAAGDPEAGLATLERALRSRPEAALAGRIHVARGDLLAKLGRTEQAREAYESGGSDYALHAAAVSALNSGDPAGAKRLVETLLEEHPTSAYRTPALLVLGEALFSEGEYADAQEQFRAALATGPDENQGSQARSRIGWCRYLQDDPAGAARGFTEVVTRHPDGAEAEEAAYMLGRAAREAGDTKTADLACTGYLERFPDGRWRAEVLLTVGRHAEGTQAQRHFAEILRDHPESELAPVALFELAERLSRTGEAARGAEHYARLLEEHPKSELVPAAHYGLGWCRYEEERYADAARALELAIETDDEGGNLALAATELLVWAYARAGNAEAATDAWRRFAARSDDDRRRFQTARAVADAWTASGEAQQALALFDELLGLRLAAEVTVEVLVEGAYLALDAADVDRAEAQVRVAKRRDAVSPAVAEAAFFVGEARFDQGEHERAARLYEDALSEGSPVLDRALYKLGFSRLRLEESKRAEEAFARLVEEHPQSDLWGEGLFLLGETRYARGELENAAAAFSRLREKAPRHAVIAKALFRHGLVLGKLARWRECETTLALLARNHPDFPNTAEAELWRGRALAAQSKQRPARQAFERVISLDKGELAAAARIGLGKLFEGEDRDEEALAEYLKVAVLYAHEASVAEALLRAGGCLERLDDPERAAKQYQEILAKYPNSSFADAAREALRRVEREG